MPRNANASPSYLVTHGTTYYFRMVVPCDLRHPLGRTEYRYSLKTSYLREARIRATRLASAVFDIFGWLRGGIVKKLTDDEIRRLAQEHLQGFIDHASGKRYNRIGRGNLEQLDEELETYSVLRSDSLRAIAEGNFPAAYRTVDNILKHHQIDVEKGSPQYHKLCDAILAATAEGMKQHCRILDGEHVYDLTTESSLYPAEPPASSVTLSEAVEKLIETRMSDWAASTAKDIPIHLREFAEITGAEMPISALNRDHMRFYLKAIRKMPSRRSQIVAYRDKSIAELMEMDIPQDKRLAPKTLDTRFINVRSLLKFAKDEGFIQNASPLSKVLAVKAIAKKSKKRTRAPFSVEEMSLLFDSSHYHKSTSRGAAKFWLPIMAAFTGARGNELSQLYLNDIHEVDGVMVLDVNDEGDKKVKSEAGIRRIPVHPFLIEVGLLDRVENLRAAGHDRLFPMLTPDSKGNHFASVSKWFTRHRREAGVPDVDQHGLKRVFHSFRHTFITRCKHLDLERRKYQEVVGHEPGEVDITDTYEGEDLLNKLLNDVVARIDFDTLIDLTHLKDSKWITKP